MEKKKEKSSRKTSLFTWWVLGWFVMYVLGIFVFPFRYPNSEFSGDNYNSFMWLWLQLYMAIFGVGYMVKKYYLKLFF